MINNSLFLVGEIPHFHPVAQKYERLSFWKEQRRRSIEGMWHSGKWIPGELYYYINFHNIKFESEGGIAVSIGLPWFRDIDLEVAYLYTEACGFSGFEGDTLYTCHRWYGPEKERALKYGWITQDDLKKKIYVEAREYLRRVHPGDLGKPLYLNSAKNMLQLGSRGYGKSYWASALIAHNFLFDGARDYDMYLEKFKNGRPYTSDTVVGAIDTKYSTDLLNKVKLAFENYPGSESIINNFGDQEIHPSPLFKPYTGSMMAGKTITSSNKSVMKHVSFKDDPLAANGTRPNRCFLEEIGFMNNLIESWGAIEATQAAAQHKRLVIYGLGTGGLTTAGAALYAQEIFYNPEAYNCIAIEDKWENRGKIGYFVPAELSRNAFKKGDNLITDEVLAEQMLDEELAEAKASNSRNKLLAYIINNPRKPSEIFLRQEGTFFPVQHLKESLAELEGNKILLKSAYKADLVMEKEGHVYIQPSDKQVITDYPLRKGMPMDACIEIYEKPKENPSGLVYGNRYIMACLPPGEKVMTDLGLRNVEDVNLYHKLINKDGEKVSIRNIQNYKAVDEDIYEFKIANTFRTTKFTGEHPLFVSNDDTGYVSYERSKRLGINQRYKKFDFKFVESKYIVAGNWIKVPNTYKNINNFNIKNFWDDANYRIDKRINNPLLEEDFWWFIGLWLGDGWCNKNGYTIEIAFNIKEKEYINKFKRVVSKLFNRQVYERAYETSVTCGFSFQQLNKFLTDWFGKYAIGKKIPEWSKYIDENLKKSLILGYLDSDGSILKNKGYWSTEFVSVNLELLESIQDILFSLGIISSITKLRDNKVEKIKDRLCTTRRTYHIRIGHGDSVKLKEILNQPDNIKLSRIISSELPILTKRTPRTNCFLSDDEKFIYFRILNIKKSKYTGVVYNFECDTHTFMCHHITTHNCDPVDDDGNDDITRSLQSTFVYDTWTDRIVAEYTARTYLAEEYYENVRKLCFYYNARLLYENNKKGLYGHFKVKNSLHLLAESPQILKDQDLVKQVGHGNRSLGVSVSNERIKLFGINLILRWLETDAYNDLSKKNLDKIRSIGLLKELISFSLDLNADRVSALIVLMIYKEELSNVITSTRKQDIKTTASDDFWGRAYPKFKKDKVYNRLNYLGL